MRVLERTGFGRGLIEKSLQGVGGKSTLRFDPAGVSCRIEVPLPHPKTFTTAEGLTARLLPPSC